MSEEEITYDSEVAAPTRQEALINSVLETLEVVTATSDNIS